MQFSYTKHVYLGDWRRAGMEDMKVESMVCRALNVKVRNMGFVHEAMGGSENKTSE